MARQEREAVLAVVNGWRQNDSGEWLRPGTEKDALTLHRRDEDNPDYDGPFGCVLASSPRECLRIDRETYGPKGKPRPGEEYARLMNDPSVWGTRP